MESSLSIPISAQLGGVNINYITVEDRLFSLYSTYVLFIFRTYCFDYMQEPPEKYNIQLQNILSPFISWFLILHDLGAFHSLPLALK